MSETKPVPSPVSVPKNGGESATIASKPSACAAQPKNNSHQSATVPPAKELTEAQKREIEKEKTIAQLNKILSKPRRKGAPPTRTELMEAAAKSGDIYGVISHWYQCDGDKDLAYVMHFARNAMHALAEKDPKFLIQFRIIECWFHRST